MGLLPAYVEDDENFIEEELEEEAAEPAEYEIDYETGQLTGRIVHGIEAIKMWIYLAVNTPRYESTIFPWTHGHDFNELKGKLYTEDVIESEAQRMIEECLLENQYITAIQNFSCKKNGEKVNMTFTVVTPYGTYDEEVEKNV